MNSAEEFFVKLQDQLSYKLPFVAYRKPGTANRAIKAFLQKDDDLHVTKDFSESGFVFAPFDDQKEAVLISQENSVIIETCSDFEITEKKPNSSISNLQDQKTSKKQHQQLVKQAVEEIRSGAFKKVVLSRKELLEMDEVEPLDIFRKLLKKYDTAFVYCWYHPKVGLWLGATPEILLEVERNCFKTMSLAGTQKYEGTTEVVWGKKEQEEQQIVTDFILENLLNISTESVESTLPYTAKAGSLLHLRTDITGKIPNSKMEIPNPKSQIPDSEIEGNSSMTEMGKLIAAIHPTPAVCGIPRESAKKFVLDNEKYDREYYTGFLGELNIKNEIKRSSNRRNQENQAYAAVVRSSALYVNLRCMKLEGNRAHLYIGGGITKGSNPEAEWEETRNKSQTMKAVL